MAQRDHFITRLRSADQDRLERCDTPNLSPRQVVCLSLSARGKSMQEIADLEKLSVETVAAHLSDVRLAFKATSIAHAAALGVRLKLI